jgi:polyhydroxyalkanoate synthesis regulator phasin
MPQPKRESSSSRSSGARKKSASRSGSGSGGTARRAAAARKTAQQRRSAAPRRTKSTAPRGKSRRGAPARKAAPTDDVRNNVQTAVEVLSRGVLLTRDRLQEVMDDAVRRGRMTRTDANDLVQDIFRLGREQTENLRSDFEQLLGRAGDAGRRAARTSPADRALREVDRARRVAGIGRFPILNYDDLTAGQITERLSDLTPAQLRKVRDYERRNANRKSVLTAIERALA